MELYKSSTVHRLVILSCLDHLIALLDSNVIECNVCALTGM